MSVTTIVDVAKALDLSIKTVSRVINQEAGVNYNTRQRVLQAIEQLGYRPNLSARALRSGRSLILALLFDNPNSYYVSAVQQGALAVCRRHGRHMTVETLGASGDEDAAVVEHLAGTLRVDGVILTPPVTDRFRLLEILEAYRTPYVRIAPAKQLDRAPRVVMDDARAAYEMTRHLIALGHRRIAIIKGHPAHTACLLRHEGFASAMREAGLAGVVAAGDFTFESGLAAARELLARDPRPTAIFASNDDMALGVLAVANEQGIAVPGEISIAGFDDTPAARMVWPQLSTVRQPIEQMAASAVEILLNIAPGTDNEPGRPAVTRVLNFSVIARGTTAPPPQGL